MGLNLSRGLPTKYYSSNRIASLIGNGLMTFIDKRTNLNEIFNSKEVVFYGSIDDLSSKIRFSTIFQYQDLAYNSMTETNSYFNFSYSY